MGGSALRGMVSCVLTVLFPFSLFAADSNAAMLYTSGPAWVNGAHVPRPSSAIFSGDLLQTRSDSVANINQPGSTVRRRLHREPFLSSLPFTRPRSLARSGLRAALGVPASRRRHDRTRRKARLLALPNAGHQGLFRHHEEPHPASLSVAARGAEAQSGFARA